MKSPGTDPTRTATARAAAAVLLAVLIWTTDLPGRAASVPLYALPGDTELTLILDGEVTWLRGNVFSEGTSIAREARWAAPELVFSLTRPLRAGEEPLAAADGTYADGEEFRVSVRFEVSRAGAVRAAAEELTQAWTAFLENGAGADPEEIRSFPLEPFLSLAPMIEWSPDAQTLRLDDVPGAWHAAAFDASDGNTGLAYRPETDDYAPPEHFPDIRRLTVLVRFVMAGQRMEVEYTYPGDGTPEPFSVIVSLSPSETVRESFDWIAERDGGVWHTRFAWKGDAPPQHLYFDCPERRTP